MQLFGHLQLFSLLPSVVSGVSLPAEVSQIANLLVSWVAFDIEMPSLVCEYPQSLADRLTLSLLGAALLLAAAPATYGLVRLGLHARRGRLDAAQGAGAVGAGAVHELTLRLFRERCAMVYVAVGLVIYAPVSAVTLRYFSCTWYGDGHYNQHDVLLLCYDASGVMSAAYRRSLPVAIAGLLAFVVGLPTANFLLLLRERSACMLQNCSARVSSRHPASPHAIPRLPLTPSPSHVHTLSRPCSRRNALETPSCQRALGLLYSKFTADSWWWDSVQMTKRLIFSSALAVLSDEPLLQVSHAPCGLPPISRPPDSRMQKFTRALTSSAR